MEVFVIYYNKKYIYCFLFVYLVYNYNMFLQNKNCYNYELRTYETGLFDTFVDATYIITSLDDKKRNENIEYQLEKCIPTKQIYMVYNKIYTKCPKILPKQIPPYDLKDAYLNIMQHSIDQNYNNILVLENDFIYIFVITIEY